VHFDERKNLRKPPTRTLMIPRTGPYRETEGRQHPFETFVGNTHAGVSDVETESAVVVHIKLAGLDFGKIKNVVDGHQKMYA